MVRHCAFCGHPDRQEFEQKLLTGQMTQSQVAKIIGRAPIQVFRHMTKHVPKAIAEATKAEPERVSAFNVMTQLRDLNETTRCILAEARQDNDNRLALKAIERAEKQLELQAKLLGQIDKSPQVNILLSPEWQHVRGIITTTLADFPQARIAIAAALKKGTERDEE